MKLFIIGYMASGKTTFGTALAEKLGVSFVDLDQYIEAASGKTISQIFEEYGEAKFREIEKNALREVAESDEYSVVACGGGTPCHLDNMSYINSKGISVFLETSTPVLVERLHLQNETRPLMAGKDVEEIREKVLTQLCERLPFYMEAKLKWQGDDLETAEQIDANVENFVASYPSLFR